MIKNRTYHNMMIVVNKIQAKGWNFDESVEMAKRIFDEYEAHPMGLSIEARIKQILTTEEWEAELELMKSSEF